jgi:hypothetical protein
MTLVDTHLIHERPRRGARVSQRQLDEYDRVQRLIEEIQADLVNGVLRSDIFRKFKERQYENLSEKNVGERQIQNYIKAAWELMREDRVDKVQELRDLLFSQYMSQYNEATEMGNVIAAKSCLDSIAKIFLPDEKTLNLNAKVEGDITIDFNLMEDEG